MKKVHYPIPIEHNKWIIACIDDVTEEVTEFNDIVFDTREQAQIAADKLNGK
jgi:hypothetical protein